MSTNLKPFDFFLLRSPLLTPEEAEELLQMPELELKDLPLLAQDAIKNSSPDFVREIEKKITHKKRLALIRYILRMSRRPTPFGFMAGYTLGQPGDKTLVEFEPKEKWIYRSRKSSDEISTLLNEGGKTFCINPTLRIEKNILHFVRRNFNSQNETQNVENLKIEMNQEGLDLIRKLQKRLVFGPIKEQSFFNDLLQIQLIIPTLSLQTYLTDHEKQWRAHFIEKRPVKIKNVILNKTAQINNFSIEQLNQIGKTVETIHRMFSTQFRSLEEKSYISLFWRTLEEKYGQDEIPLLEALDPKIGVFDTKWNNPKGLEPHFSQLKKLESFYTNKLLSQPVRVNEWNLTKQDVEEIEKINSYQKYREVKLPASLSVIFEPADNRKILLKGIVGTPAGKLFSRLSLGDKELSTKTRDLFLWEKQQNPNIIFAEIIEFPSNNKVMQYNARSINTDFVIPIDGILENFPIDHQIQLADLLISSEYGRIRIRSKKLNKEIIPILSSSYISNFDPHPYLKFLAAIAPQDNINSPSWIWGSLIKWPYLPRVRLGNMILSPRRWRLSANQHELLSKSSDVVTAFKEFAELVGLPDKLYWVEKADIKLFVDLKSDCILEAFLHSYKNSKLSKTSYFEESFPDQKVEYFAPFRNDTIQKQDPFKLLKKDTALKSTYHPIGSEWIYLKFFCNSLMMDDLLQAEIFPFVQKLKTKKIIKSWFYIRYNDPSPHVRLRLKLKFIKDWEAIRKMVHTLDKTLTQEKKIQLMQIESLKRDDIFQNAVAKNRDMINELDSERCAELIQRFGFSNWDEEKNFTYLFHLLDGIICIYYPKIDQRYEVTNKLKTCYLTMGIEQTNVMKRKYEKFYKRLKLKNFEVLDKDIELHLKNYFKSLSRILGKNNSLSMQRVIHLSLNRTIMGITYQEEDILYDLLSRRYYSSICLEATHKYKI